ncbi:MAG: hypothetical protein ACOYXN_06100 [Acidobacteriota bacterium]
MTRTPIRKETGAREASRHGILTVPRSTDEWQEWADLQGAPDVIDDGIEAVAGDEPRTGALREAEPRDDEASTGKG